MIVGVAADGKGCEFKLLSIAATMICNWHEIAKKVKMSFTCSGCAISKKNNNNNNIKDNANRRNSKIINGLGKTTDDRN
jgi:dTDP-4-dehydrorhamnose reductase